MNFELVLGELGIALLGLLTGAAGVGMIVSILDYVSGIL